MLSEPDDRGYIVSLYRMFPGYIQRLGGQAAGGSVLPAGAEAAGYIGMVEFFGAPESDNPGSAPS